jgi:hypothetical protein
MSEGTSPERPVLIAEMQRLLAEYEVYDLTVDVLAAWRHHIRHYYQEAYVDLLSALGSPSADGHFVAETYPDFTASFTADGYGVIGEVKASLSIGAQSLDDVVAQLRGYDRRDYAFRLDPDGRKHHAPPVQDILLIAPAASSTAVGRHLAALGASGAGGRPFRKNVVLCQFAEEDRAGRVLFFSRFPVRGLADSLRDGFLPADRRLSCHLDRRIELRSQDYGVQREYIVAGSDQSTSDLGVLSRVFTLVQRFYGQQLRTKQYSEREEPTPIRFSVDDLLTRLRKPPYVCSLSRTSLLSLLERLAASAPFIEVDDSGAVAYTVPKQRRFAPFRRDEIISELPRKHARGDLPLFCYHLARANLARAASTTGEPVPGPRAKQLPLFN